MEASWYLLHIRPAPPSKEDQEKAATKEEQDKETTSPDKAETDKAEEQVEEEKHEMLRVPQVGTPVVHFLGLGGDDERKKKDLDNPLWEKIQDEARPAWAPDLLRLGYTVVFKREGLPKLAAKLGIKNPRNVTKEEHQKARDRILTFDDVWVIGVVPHRMPMYFPDKDLKPEDWWLATKESKSITSPYLAPGGATVATGAQRLADVVISMLRQPNGFPRIVPTIEEVRNDMSEFINPLVPIKPVSPEPSGAPDSTNYRVGYDPETGYGWAGIELFRYGWK